jgi:formylglycine-generating enzyme required for sulfatase activity
MTQHSSSKIFISYRRTDSAAYAQSIYARLSQEFSEDRVFMDVDTIQAGADFQKAIEAAISECDVMVALIGKKWIDGDGPGTRRLEDAKDYVRLEISTALDRDVRVIPVLVDGMAMPDEQELPSSIRPITRRNALEISNTRFNYDLERLITAVRRVLDTTKSIQLAKSPDKSSESKNQPEWRRIRVSATSIGISSMAILLVLCGVWWAHQAQYRPAAISAKKDALQPMKGASPETKPDKAKEPRTGLPAFSPGTVFRDRLSLGGEGPEMVVIPGGSFRMGDVQGTGEKDELPVHTVMFQKPFAIGRYEVTFAEYDRFTKNTNRQFPSDNSWGRARRPVIFVSWLDAVEYAKWLSVQTGSRYRLPSEAEWEYAARGGSETPYWWGSAFAPGMANCRSCGSPWQGKTAPVGSFKPNSFGLYDSAGNVWEWVEECWHANYSGAPVDGSAWASGGNCARRIIRGGSWSNYSRDVRSSNRGGYYPENRDYFIGFRVVRELH